MLTRCPLLRFSHTHQADAARDALAKALYARTFDYLIAAVNKAMSAKVCIYNWGLLCGAPSVSWPA